MWSTTLLFFKVLAGLGILGSRLLQALLRDEFCGNNKAAIMQNQMSQDQR
jgi:hypothetical protein